MEERRRHPERVHRGTRKRAPSGASVARRAFKRLTLARRRSARRRRCDSASPHVAPALPRMLACCEAQLASKGRPCRRERSENRRRIRVDARPAPVDPPRVRTLSIVVALSGLTLVFSGCAGKPLASTATVQFAPSSGPRHLKPTTPEQVLVYESNGSLPAGIYFDGTTFQVKTDYPTREAPHDSLGAVYIRSDRKDEVDREMMIRRLVEEAAKHGTNALVITRCGPAESCTGTALRLSNATPLPVEYPTAAELLRAPPEKVPGGAELLGALRPGNLADFEVVTLEVSRGRCYGLGLALEKDASLNERAQ